jgi:ABC-type spermidine/putrescine transport system permease subunit II
MSEGRLKIWLVGAGSLFMLIFCLTPILYMIATSVSENPLFLSGKAHFEFSLRHYAAVLSDPSVTTDRIPHGRAAFEPRRATADIHSL